MSDDDFDYYGDIGVLKGVTLTMVDHKKLEYTDELIFTAKDKRQWKMYYEPDCCAACHIEDICGDLGDIIGSPITMAEKVTNKNSTPDGIKLPEEDWDPDSYTWTFYKLGTSKGSVTIRWFGESNGYYSEEVSFEEITD